LPADVRIKLTVYNLKGEKVRKLIDGFQTKGWKEIIWNGRDSRGKKVRGKKVASGVYFCRLQAHQASEIVKMILLK
jgi:flagellar hook assembly protein FlgD